jgi:hypothetical protein
LFVNFLACIVKKIVHKEELRFRCVFVLKSEFVMDRRIS